MELREPDCFSARAVAEECADDVDVGDASRAAMMSAERRKVSGHRVLVVGEGWSGEAVDALRFTGWANEGDTSKVETRAAASDAKYWYSRSDQAARSGAR